jgi:hypothetical protein
MKKADPPHILSSPAAIRLSEDILERAFHSAAAELASWVDAEINFQLELAGRKLPAPCVSPSPGCIHCVGHERDV